jgi:hypothetical protein
MSDALALVRFPNGESRSALYFGSTDMVVPALFPLDQAGEVLEGGMEFVLERLQEVEAELSDDEAGEGEPVEIWTACGGGSFWKG